MNAEQLPYLLAFNSLLKLKTAAIEDILDHFGGDAAEAWRNAALWPKLTRISAIVAEEIAVLRQAIEPDRLFSEYLASGAGVTVIGDEDYPRPLEMILEPPLLLFYRGNLPRADELCLAMIGSRQASPYGRQVAEIYARDLAAQGAVIVSGMARGIDSFCHQGALSAAGRTVAVLGSGVDVIYPRENDKLYQQICEQGAVVSELPLGMQALAHNFPRRNRIISGLSRCVVVIESGEKSGTLCTVDYALEQGRDVFAVPGPVTSKSSRGTNRLIKQGAKMALSAEDIWREYSEAPMRRAVDKPKRDSGQNRAEKKLLEMLQTPRQFEELAADAELAMEAAALNSLLSMLEIRGLLRQLPGRYYQAVVKNIRA